MIFSIIAGIIEMLFYSVYKVLDHYVVASFFAFIKDFEVAIFMIAAVLFLLVAVAIALRQLKKLPKSYVIEVTDLDGNRITADGIRQRFSTYEGAQSYARLYAQTYGHQYRFRVTGSTDSKTITRIARSQTTTFSSSPNLRDGAR